MLETQGKRDGKTANKSLIKLSKTDVAAQQLKVVESMGFNSKIEITHLCFGSVETGSYFSKCCTEGLKFENVKPIIIPGLVFYSDVPNIF